MLNVFITVTALVVGVVQVLFLFNLVWSLFKGREASGNPWRATTLEWQTPETPPPHGNWGKDLPVVYRWAYDYSVPGAAEDFIPQNQPPGAPPVRRARSEEHTSELQSLMRSSYAVFCLKKNKKKKVQKQTE